MRSTKHKLLAALLSVCLFVGLAVPAFAEDTENPPTKPAANPTEEAAEPEEGFGERPTKTDDVKQQPDGAPEVIVYSGKDGSEDVIYWCFLANGTPVTVTQNKTDSKKIDISYDGQTYTSPEYKWNNEKGDIVTYRLCIFGGGHNSTTRYESTSVTLESGEIFILSGGGLHGSKIGTTNTVMKGGFASNVYASGIGYGGISSDGCGNAEKYEDNDRTLIDNAKITINDGACNLLCGGPMSYGHTVNAAVTMTGGEVRAYGSPSGTNGYTENAVYKMSGGSITELYGVINGKTKNVTMEITGDASVTTVMHAASDDVGILAGDPSISLTIDTTGTVEKLSAGYNGDKNPVVTAGIIKGEYKRSCINNADKLLGEPFGEAFVDLLPIPESTKVEVSTEETDADKIKEAVETAVKSEIEKDGTAIKNGDTVVANTAKVPDGTADAVNAMLNNVSNIPGPEGVQVTQPSKNGNKSGVLVSNLTAVEATADVITAVTFDVTPYVYTPSGGSGSSLEENKNPGNKIIFRLPVPSDWNGWVDAWHDKASLGHKEILTGETGVKYVELSSNTFSPFKLAKSNWKPTPTPTPSPSYSSGSYSSEFFVKVIAGANGKAKVEEGFYARDDKHTFTMIPDEGYVIDTVTLDDGSVLSHTDTEFVLFVDEPYDVHVTFKKAVADATTVPVKPSTSKNPQTGDSWFANLLF